MTTRDVGAAVAAENKRTRWVSFAFRQSGCALAGCVLLAIVVVLGLRFGSLPMTSWDAINALVNYSPDSYEQTIVRYLRLPRTVIGLGVGAALAVAGAAMQATTRNPLADPSILGVNSGAAFGVVTAVYFGQLTIPSTSSGSRSPAASSPRQLYTHSAPSVAGGASPVKLALAGVVVSALLNSWLTALLLLDRQTLDVVRFWLAGSLAGRDIAVFYAVSPFLIVGLAGHAAGGKISSTC